jgi:hypothetical protein
MTTARALGMTLSTDLTAIGLIIGHNGICKIHNAKTGWAGTFHLGYGSSHSVLQSKLYNILYSRIYEQLFKYLIYTFSSRARFSHAS